MIKPYKSLWAILLISWPVAVAKFYAGDFNGDGEMIFIKFLAAIGLVIGACILLSLTMVSSGAFLAALGLLIAVFDGIRLYGHYLLAREASTDE